MAKRLLFVVLALISALSLFSVSCSSEGNLFEGNKVATIGSNGIYVGVGVFTPYQYVIFVDLKPASSAIAGEVYKVDLYEKGTFRATTTVTFTQPDINVQSDETAYFPATDDEYTAYLNSNINNIFSVKVYNPNDITTTTKQLITQSVLINTNQPATLTLTSPDGGEIWHVGQTVNITWKTTNMNRDVSIAIDLYTDYDNNSIPLIIGIGATNTGSYQWTVNPIMEAGHSYSVISSDARIELMANGGGYGVVLTSISANDFTITN